MSAGERPCCYCGATEREVRPYGPGGSWTCFPCAFDTPERKARTEAAYGTLLDTADAMSPIGVTAIGTEAGPQPMIADDLREDSDEQ